MHKVTLLLTSFILGLTMVAAFVTAGIVTGMLWLHILALWIFLLLSAIFLGFFLRVYRLVMTRLGTANQRLSEMKLLQERRYEQLAQRLDALNHNTLGHSRSPVSGISAHQDGPPKLSEIEHLIARTERAERRILGRLENIMLDNDTCLRAVKKLAPNFDD